MGMTRATGVRCPWCARPVGDGPDRPGVCPSCGVPLAPATTAASPVVSFAVPAVRARRSQRLRASAVLLALTSVIFLLAAVPLAVHALESDHGNALAQRNLVAVLRAAEGVKHQTGEFAGAQPAVLTSKVVRIKVFASPTPSSGPAEISMQVAGDGWYGAVRSASGPCFAAASVGGEARMLQAVLPGNCTGDAARATLAPVGTRLDATITAAPGNTSTP